MSKIARLPGAGCHRRGAPETQLEGRRAGAFRRISVTGVCSLVSSVPGMWVLNLDRLARAMRCRVKPGLYDCLQDLMSFKVESTSVSRSAQARIGAVVLHS